MREGFEMTTRERPSQGARRFQETGGEDSPPGPETRREALVVLPGITATPAKQAFLRAFLETHSGCDVFLPRLWQAVGIRGSAWQLHRFLRTRVEESRYAAVHFLSYISGGFILRAAMSRWPLANIGRLVHVRSPLQEQVPGRVISTYGRVAAFFLKGRMMFDLASPWKDELPFAKTRHSQGMILERGLSKMGAALGLKASDFEALRQNGGFIVPPVDETLIVPESHDEVYTSESLLGCVVHFIQSGKF